MWKQCRQLLMNGYTMYFWKWILLPLATYMLYWYCWTVHWNVDDKSIVGARYSGMTHRQYEGRLPWVLRQVDTSWDNSVWKTRRSHNKCSRSKLPPLYTSDWGYWKNINSHIYTNSRHCHKQFWLRQYMFPPLVVYCLLVCYENIGYDTYVYT